MKRVVITGCGCVSGAGAGVGPFWEAVCGGRPLVRRITHFDPAGFRTQIAAIVDPRSLPALAPAANPNLYDLTARISIIATREAATRAGLDSLPADAGVFWGTAVGPIGSLDSQFENFYVHGRRRVKAFTVPRTMVSASAALLAMQWKLHGPNYTLSTACSAAAHAIGLAYRMVREGQLDFCIAGGSECPVSPGHLQAWDRLRVLAAENETPWRACRPFSGNRCGLVLGDGAATLILEEMGHARRRGALPLAEVVGYGSNCSVKDLLQPDGDSQTACIRQAVEAAQRKRAGALPDYICAHGTGTRDGDRAETAAIRKAFARDADSIPVSSIKGVVGHTLGASGALSVVAALQAIETGILPPTINLEEPDPECDLDYVANQSRPQAVRLALVNSFGFGGSNAVLALAVAPTDS